MNFQNRAKFLGIMGWILAVLGFVFIFIVFTKVRYRIIQRPPHWKTVTKYKQQELRSRWQDERPLIVFLGDSHVELGAWYDLFCGRFAVRNCGLSMSRIKDLVPLTEALPQQSTSQLLIMCGVNNLAAGDSVDDCLKNYNELLNVVQRRFGTTLITVLGVLPVRDVFHDEKARRLNCLIKEYNNRLARLCAERGCRFLNLSKEVTSTSGALDSNYTSDGLHLNILGYRIFARSLEANLFCENMQ
jgi:GDSL-like Lipase/Acylhydrolase family